MTMHKQLFSATLSVAVAFAFASVATAQIELATNGDFETGDVSGWDVSFLTGSQSFGPTGFVAGGATAGELVNPDQGTGGVIKQANIGIGVVSPGQEITISFDAAGNFGVGGVAFAELFSEVDGGGTSASEILSGGPLALTSSYQPFSFTALAGPDVSGGITLQFNAATGAVAGSTAQLFIDNVSVSVIPEPATVTMMALAGVGACFLRRRR
ncbi:MAG: PEP-CTERM sorting domain-containing protein [Planctomycetota bacterium]